MQVGIKIEKVKRKRWESVNICGQSPAAGDDSINYMLCQVHIEAALSGLQRAPPQFLQIEPFLFFLFLLSKGYLVQVSTYKQSSFSVYEISVKDAKPGQARETGTVWLA